MAALRAKKPEHVEPSKPKFLMSGKSGVGKTMFALSFPKVYYIDTEGGAVREQYRQKLVASGGAYMGKEEGSQDFNVVIEEIKTLATTKHEYSTLVIDSFSFLYNLAAAKAEEKIGSDFGKDKKEANKPTRQLMRWLEDLDMTVLLVCHHKEKWERKNGELLNVGTTFDGFEKMEYSMDLWVEVLKEGKSRMFLVKKSRIQSFQEGDLHALDYGKFSELYGREVIERPTEPVKLATPEQLAMMNEAIDILNINATVIQKWYDKEGCDKFEDMREDRIAVYIKAVQDKIAAVAPKTTPPPPATTPAKSKREVAHAA